VTREFSGTAVKPVKDQVNAMLANSPEANVDDFSDYVHQQANSLNTVLTMIQGQAIGGAAERATIGLMAIAARTAAATRQAILHFDTNMIYASVWPGLESSEAPAERFLVYGLWPGLPKTPAPATRSRLFFKPELWRIQLPENNCTAHC